MRFLSIPTGTGEQAALLESRARLVFLAGNQRVFLVVTIERFVSVTQLAENDSHPEAGTKALRDTRFQQNLLYGLVNVKTR